MRFPPTLLLVLATVGVGCSSGSTVTIPYPDRDLSGQSLVLVSTAAEYDLSDEVPSALMSFGRTPSARQLVADVFDMGVNTAERYEEVFFDSLHAALEESVDFERVDLGIPDDSLELVDTRVMARRRSRSGSLDPYIVTVPLPAAGAHFQFGGISPEFVLLITELNVWTQKGDAAPPNMHDPSQPTTLLPNQVADPTIRLGARFVLWDNRSDEVYGVGRVTAMGKEKGLVLEKEFNRESFQDLVEASASAIIQEVRLATK